MLFHQSSITIAKIFSVYTSQRRFCVEIMNKSSRYFRRPQRFSAADLASMSLQHRGLFAARADSN